MNTESYTENNKVVIAGTVASEPEFSHEVYEEVFYTFMLNTPRLSETRDTVKVTISEKFLMGEGLAVGDMVVIQGQFRSYNNFTNVGNRLILTVFVKDIEKTEDEEKSLNSICLNGYICKKPVYRTTPFGREIADILLAVNRSYNKSDYIPCIAWGRNAKFAECLNVGDNVVVKGRIQSREYQKRLSDTEVESKTAFEVSVSRMEVCERFAE
ncbi:MAG: single-stranded DNA-binding protein [Clostridia bacterium]|nr:single-stranded DNA-binding protein [Oscillospiraceae bacterium]MBQ7960325.1 single-stranded DNA-binding protein [Clostridia bacterium]